MKTNQRMTWRAAVAMTLALLVVSLALAQQPSRGRDGGREPPAKGDAALDAWIKILTDKITDRHDSIRESAREALVVVGRPALPALKKLAEGDDGADAEAARKIIARIENGGRPGPGFPGWPGGLPGSPGDIPGVPGGIPNPMFNWQGVIGPVLSTLDLTERQKTKVAEIFPRLLMEETARQAREGPPKPDEIPAVQERLLNAYLKELKTMLTEEQFKKAETTLKRNGGRPDSGRGP